MTSFFTPWSTVTHLWLRRDRDLGNLRDGGLQSWAADCSLSCK